MRDNLPQTPFYREAAIVNLNTSSQSGSHWTAYKKQGNEVKYFDSFGQLPPCPELVGYLKNCVITYNNKRYQNFNDQNCGQLCVYFLKNRLKECPTY